MKHNQGEPMGNGLYRFRVRVRGPDKRVSKEGMDARVAKAARKANADGKSVERAQIAAWKAIRDGNAPKKAVKKARRKFFRPR